MTQAKALYRLQRLDLDLDARRSRVQAITALLEQDEALREAEAAVVSVEQSLRPEQTRATDLNLELKTIATQTAQLTDRLYGGTVSNPKELEDIQEKIAERKRRHAKIEDRLLETMIAIDDLQDSRRQAEAHLEHVRATRSSEHDALQDELRQLKVTIKRLKVEREAALEPVAADSLALYQALRPKKQGNVVAVLDGDSCTICGVEQTTTLVQRARQDRELVMCSSCGRILVAL
jgi:uncharacterized protein